MYSGYNPTGYGGLVGAQQQAMQHSGVNAPWYIKPGTPLGAQAPYMPGGSMYNLWHDRAAYYKQPHTWMPAGMTPGRVGAAQGYTGQVGAANSFLNGAQPGRVGAAQGYGGPIAAQQPYMTAAQSGYQPLFGGYFAPIRRY